MKIKSMYKQKKKYTVSIFVIAILIALILFTFRGKTNKISYELAPITLGDIQSVVQATGTVQPVETVDVGTQISGRIEELYFDYNSKVEKGQLIALMDSDTYEANKLEAQASVASCISDIETANITLEKARLDYNRALELVKDDLIAKSEVDSYRATYKKAIASVAQSKARLRQARASLKRAEINLNYTRIYSPVSGVVTMKNVEKGQTVAASYQTPSIAKIAKDLTDMQVEANIDEADIGNIKEGQKAIFDVDSYPDLKFEGIVSQLRLSPVNNNNVVTYTVVIKVKNKDKKLLPGMTANINIILQEKKNVKCVPNAAFRFRPQETEIKSKGFIGFMGRKHFKNMTDSSQQNGDGAVVHLLVKGKPIPYGVKIGITDGINTELISDLEVGSPIIVGINLPPDQK